MSAPRVRFAPSPTGALHIGGARTALFNWLFARHTGGTLVLRIEDTDGARSTEANTQVILDGLRWLGLSWDEGPVFQSASAARHRQEAEALVATGKAYRDFSTGWLDGDTNAPEDQAEAKEDAPRRPFDRAAHQIDPWEAEVRAARGELHAIRFLMPSGELDWEDAVRGRVSFAGSDLEDFVLIRRDGMPTYNMAVVSDDIAMRISHVIRGEDHVSNTPKQLALYAAMGATPPVFAHVSMILGEDGKKLSKRHGATSVASYADLGLVPAALRNFLALLGWSPGGDEELMTEARLIEAFELDRLHTKPAIFDTQKLAWMNAQYIAAMAPADLIPLLTPWLPIAESDPARVLPLIQTTQARARTLGDLAADVTRRLPGADTPLDARARPWLAAADRRQVAEAVRRAAVALATIEPEEWTHDRILAALRVTAQADGVKLGALLQPVRVALLGVLVSEPVSETLVVLGRDESLRRLRDWPTLARRTEIE